MSWTDSARCAEVGPEAFFLEDSDNKLMLAGQANALYNQAKRVCADCPVSRLCLDEALALEHGADSQYRHGVWGGLSPRERYVLDVASRVPVVAAA
jgi:WhiB family transcriptional regulator, redox-sensing transcriptional regulator